MFHFSALNLAKRRLVSASFDDHDCDIDSDYLDEESTLDCIDDNDAMDDCEYLQPASPQCYDFSELLLQKRNRKRTISGSVKAPVNHDTSRIHMLSGDCIKKNYVIFLEDDDARIVEPTPVTTVSYDEAPPAAAVAEHQPSTHFDSIPESHVVLVDSDSIAALSLKQQYGNAYTEGQSAPRKFMISVKKSANSFERLFLLFENADDARDLDCTAVDEWTDLLHTHSQHVRLVRVHGIIILVQYT